MGFRPATDADLERAPQQENIPQGFRLATEDDLVQSETSAWDYLKGWAKSVPAGGVRGIAELPKAGAIGVRSDDYLTANTPPGLNEQQAADISAYNMLMPSGKPAPVTTAIPWAAARTSVRSPEEIAAAKDRIKTPVEQTKAYRLGQKVEDWVDTSKVPKEVEEGYVYQGLYNLGRMGTQIVPMMAARGPLGAATGVFTGSGAGEATDMFERARQQGVDEETAVAAAQTAKNLGVADVVGMAGLFGILGKIGVGVTGKTGANIVKRIGARLANVAAKYPRTAAGLAGAAEELVTEIPQTWGEDEIARAYFNEVTNSFQNMRDAGIVASGTGFLVGIMLRALGIKAKQHVPGAPKTSGEIDTSGTGISADELGGGPGGPAAPTEGGPTPAIQQAAKARAEAEAKLKEEAKAKTAAEKAASKTAKQVEDTIKTAEFLPEGTAQRAGPTLGTALRRPMPTPLAQQGPESTLIRRPIPTGPSTRTTGPATGVLPTEPLPMPQTTESKPPPVFPWHPVQEAMKQVFKDRTIAEATARELSKQHGVNYHVWSTPNGYELRLGPQPQQGGPAPISRVGQPQEQLGSEYEQWLDSLGQSEPELRDFFPQLQEEEPNAQTLRGDQGQLSGQRRLGEKVQDQGGQDLQRNQETQRTEAEQQAQEAVVGASPLGKKVDFNSEDIPSGHIIVEFPEGAYLLSETKYNDAVTELSNKATDRVLLLARDNFRYNNTLRINPFSNGIQVLNPESVIKAYKQANSLNDTEMKSALIDYMHSTREAAGLDKFTIEQMDEALGLSTKTQQPKLREKIPQLGTPEQQEARKLARLAMIQDAAERRRAERTAKTRPSEAQPSPQTAEEFEELLANEGLASLDSDLLGENYQDDRQSILKAEGAPVAEPTGEPARTTRRLGKVKSETTPGTGIGSVTPDTEDLFRRIAATQVVEAMNDLKSKNPAVRTQAQQWFQDNKSGDISSWKMAAELLGWPEDTAQKILKGEFDAETAKKALKSYMLGENVVTEDELSVDPVTGVSYLYSFGGQMNPDEMIKIHETVQLPGGDWKKRMSRSYWNWIGTPQGGAMRMPETLGKLFKTATKRVNDGLSGFVNAFGALREWGNMTKEEQDLVRKVIHQIDGQPIKSIPSKSITLLDNGRVEVNPQYTKEYNAWVDSKPWTDRVKSYFKSKDLASRQAFADLHNEFYREGVDETTLEKLRNHIGFIPNHYPHIWYGNHYLIGRDANGNPRAHIPIQAGLVDKKRGNTVKHIEAIQQIMNDPKWASAGVVSWDDKAMEVGAMEKYYMDSPVPVDVINRVLQEGVDRAEAKIREYESSGKPDAAEKAEDLRKMASAFRSVLEKSTATIIKGKGFGNLMERQGRLGYETENIHDVYFDYFHGVYSSIAKLKAARAYTSDMFKMKPGHNELKMLTDFIEDDMSPRSELDNFVARARGGLYLWFLAGRIRSGLVNMTNAITSGVPLLSLHSTGAGTEFMRAVKDLTMQYMKEPKAVRGMPDERGLVGVFGTASGKGNRLNQYELRSMIKLFNEGNTQAQLFRELKGQTTRGSMWDGMLDWLGIPMAVSEWGSRASIALAAYRSMRDGKIVNQRTLDEFGLTKGQKLDESVDADRAKLEKFAEQVVTGSHGTFARYAKPYLFRHGKVGTVLSPFYTFRYFNQHMMELWHWLGSKQYNPERGRQAVARSLIAQGVFGGLLKGIPLAYTMAKLWGAFTDRDPEEDVREMLPGSNTMKDMVLYGAPAGVGLSVGSSFDTNLPDSIIEGISMIATGLPADPEARLKIGQEAGGAVSGIVRNIIGAAQSWANGNKERAMEYLAPMFIRQVLEAVRKSEGSYSISGTPLPPNMQGVEPLRYSTMEAVGKGLGFGVAREEKQWNLRQGLARQQDKRNSVLGHLASRYVNAMNSGDTGAQIGVIDELMAWNLTMIGKDRVDMAITQKSFEQSVRQRMSPRRMPEQMRGRQMELEESYGLGQ